jgi:hypothetical protein
MNGWAFKLRERHESFVGASQQSILLSDLLLQGRLAMLAVDKENISSFDRGGDRLNIASQDTY